MDRSYVLKYDYVLKHRDTEVIKFNPMRKEVKVINPDLIPLPIKHYKVSYDMITSFCDDRILMYNRGHCKEILISLGIDDQTPVNICIVSNGLSFFDDYWITKARDTRKWSEVNLFQNEFSTRVAYTGLTGDIQYWDNIFTGELTLKGTKPKGVFREDGKIYLYKHETETEVASEIISGDIADALDIPHATYTGGYKFNKYCSKCELNTNTIGELLPCRAIMSYYRENQITVNSKTFQFMRNAGGINFDLMIVFDYLTLNLDRNRDNFGLILREDGMHGLYPLFDHDACFKSKNGGGTYFPTTSTFDEAIKILAPTFSREVYKHLKAAIDQMHSLSFSTYFAAIKSNKEYTEMLDRAHTLLEMRTYG